MDTSYTYRDLSRLTYFLKLMISGYIISNLLHIITLVGLYVSNSPLLLPEETDELAFNTPFEVVSGFLTIFDALIILPYLILFTIWIYRTNVNIRALGATNVKFSPFGSVIFYLIPILCFWKPKQAMSEIWTASSYLSYDRHASNSSIVGWWWSFFLIGSLSDSISFFVANLHYKHQHTVSIDYIFAVDMFGSVSSFLFHLISYHLVTQIYKMQKAAKNRMVNSTLQTQVLVA